MNEKERIIIDKLSEGGVVPTSVILREDVSLETIINGVKSKKQKYEQKVKDIKEVLKQLKELDNLHN